MKEFKAPAIYAVDGQKPWVFLAGSIEMGEAEPWQEWIVSALEDFSGSLLNPRREDWDSSWEQRASNPQFLEQVEWELTALENSDLIVVYFDPETRGPITLLELGLFARHGMVVRPYTETRAGLIVYCPDGFWRKGNVEIVCSRYGISMYNTKEAFLAAIARWLTEDKQ
jgi:hypothetical protein